MAEARSDASPFTAEDMHTIALAAPRRAALMESVSDYYGLSRCVLEVGRSCITPGARVLDLRCDLRAVMPLIHEHEDLCRFTLLSPDEESCFRCFDRLRVRVGLGFVETVELDLAHAFPELSARMVISLGALGHLSERRRVEVAECVHRRLERNGAVVVMEFIGDEIERGGRGKRRPWSAMEWESLFRHAGFRETKRIWTDGERMVWSLGK